MTPEAFPLEQINQKVTIEDALLKVDMTNSVLSLAGKQELQQIIRENQKVFLPNEDGKISFTPYLQQKIHLIEGKVVCVPGLRIPHAWRAEVKEQVQQLIDGGAVERSLSPYLTPLVARENLIGFRFSLP